MSEDSGKDENRSFLQKLRKDIIKNPLTLGLLIVAILGLCAAIYFGAKSNKLEAEKLILEKEKAEMSKPIIITAGLRVGGVHRV